MQKVLLVKLSSMGDVIHTLPAITDLARACPDIELDWAIDPSFQEIASWHPFVKNIIPIPIRNWKKKGFLKSIISGEIKHTIKSLKHKSYDYIIDAQGLLKSALTAYNASCKTNGKKIGYSRKCVRDPIASLFYDKKYLISNKLLAVEKTRELFAAHFKYKLNKYALDYGIAKKILSKNYKSHKLINKTKNPYIICFHGTTWTTKVWPTQHWVDFVIESIKKGFAIKITSGNDLEFNRAQKIKLRTLALIPDAQIQVLPRMELNDIAILIAHAKASVSSDTGFGHLAAALNLPQVSIFGATNSELTRTYGLNQDSIQSDIYCSPCMKRKCLNPRFNELGYPPCYENITAKKVWIHLDKLISNTNKKQIKRKIICL